MREKTFLSLVYRWPVEQIKREAAGTEERSKMDATVEGKTETAPPPTQKAEIPDPVFGLPSL